MDTTHQINTPDINELSNFQNAIYRMPMGKERRNIIKSFFELYSDFSLKINDCGFRQLKRDSDLKYLVKQGFLKQTKSHPYKNSTFHETRLVKV